MGHAPNLNDIYRRGGFFFFFFFWSNRRWENKIRTASFSSKVIRNSWQWPISSDIANLYNRLDQNYSGDVKNNFRYDHMPEVILSKKRLLHLPICEQPTHQKGNKTSEQTRSTKSVQATPCTSLGMKRWTLVNHSFCTFNTSSLRWRQHMLKSLLDVRVHGKHKMKITYKLKLLLHMNFISSQYLIFLWGSCSKAPDLPCPWIPSSPESK